MGFFLSISNVLARLVVRCEEDLAGGVREDESAYVRVERSDR